MGTGGLSEARLGRMHDVLAGFVERGDFPGLVALVSRGDDVHVEAVGARMVGGDPIQRDSIFQIASMTKPILAAATMLLVEECQLRLDDPVDPWLPELADRRVLVAIDGPVDDTVSANRSITVRDLLTLRLGIGALLAAPGTYPIQQAIADAGVEPGPSTPSLTHDEWIRRLGELPLLYQPGERWIYHTGFDVLCVLLARVTGQPLGDVLRERVFDPLGMVDTGFHVPADQLHRLTAGYDTDPETGALVLRTDPRDTELTNPPTFASEVLSTADDYLAFNRMLLDKGQYPGGRLLSRPSVELMTTNHLTPQQKVGSELLLGDSTGWGFGVSVTTRREDLWAPGRFGWVGGLGTWAYVDPDERLVTILLTQRPLGPPVTLQVSADFSTTAYAALED